jgi:hypothetical protein
MLIGLRKPDPANAGASGLLEILGSTKFDQPIEAMKQNRFAGILFSRLSESFPTFRQDTLRWAM